MKDSKPPKKFARRIPADHGYRVHAVWWKGVPKIGIIVQRDFSGKSFEIRPGASLPAWLTKAQARRLRDALTEAIR